LRIPAANPMLVACEKAAALDLIYKTINSDQFSEA